VTKTELAALRRSIRAGMHDSVYRLLVPMPGQPDDMWESDTLCPHEWKGPVVRRELKAAMAAFDRWLKSIEKIQEGR